MSWYRIKSYSNVNYIDLSSKTQISSGITLVFADDNPFCISVADREFRLLKNDFCIFFSGTHYRIYTDKNTAARIIYLELAPDREYSGYQSIKRLAESESNLEKMLFCKRTHLIGSGSDGLKKLLLLLLEIHSTAAKQNRISPVAEHLIAPLLTEAAECLFGKNANEGICLHTKKAISFISKNFQNDISLKEISDFTGVGIRRLQGLFKEELGCTVSDYICSFRISYACDLLRFTSTPINELAAAVGFNNRQHFTLTFRQKCGITPSRFREEWKKRSYSYVSENAGDPGVFASFIHTKSDIEIDGENE